MAAFGEFSGSILVADASVLINDRSIDRMDLIDVVSYEFMVTDHVAGAFAISCATSPEGSVQQLIKYRPFPALFDGHDKNLHRISGLSTTSAWEKRCKFALSSVSDLWGTVHIVACRLEVDYMP